MEYINKQFLLDKRPVGMPEDDCWKLNEESITSIKNNEIIIEVTIKTCNRVICNSGLKKVGMLWSIHDMIQP